MGNKLASLGELAFSYCHSLTNFTIPDSVESVGRLAFFGCSKLGSVTVGAGVRSLGEAPWSGCASLRSVFFRGGRPDLEGATFSESLGVVVYYLPGQASWGPTYGGRPTVLWNARMVVGDGMFGMRAGRFGFTIEGTSGLEVVVESSPSVGNPVWTSVASRTLSGGVAQFIDGGEASGAARIYRLRSP